MELVLRPYIEAKSEVEPVEADAARSLLEVINSFAS
jgi:hypothetical protein